MKTSAVMLSLALLVAPAASAEYLFPRATLESDPLKTAIIIEFDQTEQGEDVIVWIFHSARPPVAVICKVDEATLQLYRSETPQDRTLPRPAYVIDTANLPENCQTGTATPSGPQVTKSA